MSHGLGRLQRALLGMIRHRGKPVTFAELRGTEKPSASLERSVRRALHRMTKQNILIALGDGRPGDPYRYFLHPLFIGMVMGKTPEADALQAALEADPGAEKAAAAFMADFTRPRT